jgi:hypothetical protein
LCLPGKGEDAPRAFVLGREAEEAAALGDKVAKDLIKQAAEAFSRARPQHERPSIILDQTRRPHASHATCASPGHAE